MLEIPFKTRDLFFGGACTLGPPKKGLYRDIEMIAAVVVCRGNVGITRNAPAHWVSMFSWLQTVLY